MPRRECAHGPRRASHLVLRTSRLLPKPSNNYFPTQLSKSAVNPMTFCATKSLSSIGLMISRREDRLAPRCAVERALAP